MASRAAALVLVALFASGCGSDPPAPSGPARLPRPIEAEHTVDAFLYAPPKPAGVCPRLWVVSAASQSRCAALLHGLTVARSRRAFAPPKRGTIQYRLAGVSGNTVQIEAGDRQPGPSKGPPSFYGIFDLQRAGSGWKIVSVSPSPRA